MDWVRKSKPALVEAIVASFRSTPERVRQDFSRFTAEDWALTESWLDDSGMALYLLDRLQWMGVAGAMAASTRQRLEQKLEDNKTRAVDMLEEFVAINRAFLDDGIRYANLKGFTLFPYSCPDLSLRQQSDCDFLIDPAHLGLARSLLEARGYAVTGWTARTLEFKSGRMETVCPGRRYKATGRRSVELHISLGSLGAKPDAWVRDERLDRVSELRCGDASFPALSGADQLACQALHLLGHLRSEHTRASWLLEFRHHAMVRRDDTRFWQELRSLASGDRTTTIALGLATMLAREIFGEFSTPEQDSWTVDALPRGVRVWAERYGRRAVLADVPGTKLYLLLNSALRQMQTPQQGPSGVRALIPLRRPLRLLQAPANETLRLRIEREIVELRFFWFRLRFHLKQGVVYAIEASRWKRLLRQCGDAPRASSAVGRVAVRGFGDVRDDVAQSSITK